MSNNLWRDIIVTHTAPPMPEPEPGREQTFVTFGMKYAHDPHPVIAAAHPDGWLVVDFPEGQRELARKVLFAYTDGQFAFDYDRAQFEESAYLYPHGELARLVLP